MMKRKLNFQIRSLNKSVQVLTIITIHGCYSNIVVNIFFFKWQYCNKSPWTSHKVIIRLRYKDKFGQISQISHGKTSRIQNPWASLILCLCVWGVVLGSTLLPGVLMGPCALALLRSAAQRGVKEPKVEQELQGSVLSHGERGVLRRAWRTQDIRLKTLNPQNVQFLWQEMFLLFVLFFRITHDAMCRYGRWSGQTWIQLRTEHLAWSS